MGKLRTKLKAALLTTLMVASAIINVGLNADFAAAAPPEGFQTTPLVTSGLDGPSGFEIAPDGRIFILERTGTIKIYKNGQLLPEPFAVLPSVGSGDRGLIGVAFDPEFGVLNNYVYFYYTAEADLLNYLVRFDASGDIGTDGPRTIFKTTFPSQELHVGGSVQFGPDGKLYFAVGDNGYPPNGQDLTNPHGKILRINRDGTVPEDNPFYGPDGRLDEIWAYGMRNPWRFQFDSATGNLFGADVGDFSWEEVNRIVKGGNYGWPLKEGYCDPNCEGTISPIYTYPHAGFSAAVTGGPVYRATQWPEEYRGDLFFADYAQGFIKGMNLDENGNNAGIYSFDDNAGSVVDMKVGPDGSMYYITYWPGRLYRISYNNGNGVPTANATSDITKGMDPMTVNFSSEGSSDPEDDELFYTWNFDDGTTSTEANPTHVFTQKGTYTVELQVSDGVNIAQAVPIVIQVGTPPQVRISVPAEGFTYKAGDQVTYNAFANDAAGFDLNDAQMSTDVILHHDTHTHPFLDNLIGRANTFTIPDHGESSANTWYRIITTVTDSNGLMATDEVNIYPEVVNFTVQADVTGIKPMLDGVPYESPRVVQGVKNFKRELSAMPIVKGADDVYYQFSHWSDGGAIRHQILTPLVDGQIFTAHYVPAPAFVAEYYDNPELTGDPVMIDQDYEINKNWGEGSPREDIPVNQFGVRWSKNQFFAAGRYRFTTATDDGVRLYIDGQLVIDKWVNQNAAHSAVVDLTQGDHEIIMEYFEGWGGATARLFWETTPDQPAQVPTTYQAEYFANMNLTGAPAVTRTDAAIDFDWAGAAPAMGLPADHFSVRWTRTIDVEEGLYRFTANADDGIRILVDGKVVLDKWVDQAAPTHTVDVPLTAGSHSLVVEYYDNYWNAIAKVSFERVGDIPEEPNDPENPTNAFRARYWNTPEAGSSPEMPMTPADVTRQETAIDIQGYGVPAAGITADKYVARWNRHFTEGGTYTFTTTADDGVRIYVSGEMILDKWIDQGGITYTVSKAISGPWDLVVEYYENTGGSVMQFGVELTTPEPSTLYSAKYWNIAPGTAVPAIPDTTPDAVREEEAINNNTYGSPLSGITEDWYVAEWTKTIAAGGTYEVTATADDGIRVYVNDQLVIDKWIDQGATTYKVAFTASDNWTLKIEYYEKTGGSVAQVAYEATATPPPALPWTAEFWNIPEGNAPEIPAGAPILTRQFAEIDVNWGASPGAGVNADHFFVRWSRSDTLEAGTYRFSTKSDDGIRVYIDGVLVLDKWMDQSAEEVFTADIELAAGEHTIVVEYYDNYWNAIANVAYELLPVIQ